MLEQDRLAPAAATPEADLARRSADAMLDDDKASRAAGVELVEVGPGRAVTTMTVRDDMVNGHGIAHGGYVFLLADTAFAVACNTYGQSTVAAGCDIAFLAPVHGGRRADRRRRRSGTAPVAAASTTCPCAARDGTRRGRAARPQPHHRGHVVPHGGEQT